MGEMGPSINNVFWNQLTFQIRILEYFFFVPISSSDGILFLARSWKDLFKCVKAKSPDEPGFPKIESIDLLTTALSSSNFFLRVRTRVLSVLEGRSWGMELLRGTVGSFILEK